MRAFAVAFALSVTLIGSGCSGFGGGEDQPTTRVVFEAVPAPGRELSEERLEEAAEIMRDRAEMLGLEAKVDRDAKLVAIEVPTEVVDRAVDILPRTAKLEFFDLQADLVPGVSLDEEGFPRASIKPLKPRAKTVVITCGPPTPYCPGVEEEPRRTYYYLFRDDPDLTGADLDRRGTRQDFDREPIVLIQFTKTGARKFETVTRTLAERGRVLANRDGLSGPENDIVNQQFAIVLDNELKSAPTVDFDENPGGIPGDNGAQITGLVTVQEARDLALVLQVGALPFAFRRVE
jgi:preprotein translocase subunit SecD